MNKSRMIPISPNGRQRAADPVLEVFAVNAAARNPAKRAKIVNAPAF
jgi:hypothetical protein